MSGSVPERQFLSIGEVLDLLKDEFPDVTISKIRFLESQGLLDPERTPSGYRKFYDADVERLRWILRQQREHFLPLKVIRENLSRGEGAPAGEPTGAPSRPGSPPAPGASATGADVGPARWSRTTESPGGPLDAGVSGVSLTREELLSAADLSAGDLDELERYELLGGRPVAGQLYYDEDALVVARLASAFARHGVEARHLRMYKTSAEREAGFYEQVVLPLMKQRNPASRRQAIENLADLARLGEGIRAALLRRALREHTDQG